MKFYAEKFKALSMNINTSFPSFDLISPSDATSRLKPSAIFERRRSAHPKLDDWLHNLKGQAVERYEPPVPPKGKLTLLLDLVETLIHTSEFPPHPDIECFRVGEPQMFVFLRPGLTEFLQWATNQFDTFIFTYGDESYAEPIIKRIAPNIPKDHRLYRRSCSIRGNSVFKDIRMVRDDLKRVILVDDNMAAKKFHPKNTIVIESWKGSPKDTAFADQIIPTLTECLSVEDVRLVIHDHVKISRRSRSKTFFTVEPPLPPHNEPSPISE